MARTAPGSPSGVRTLRARARGHLAHVALAFGRGQPARISRGVVGRVQQRLRRPPGRSDRRPDGLVERRARRGVQQHRRQHPLGRDGRQLDDHPATHRVAHEDGLAHTERVERSQRQFDAMAQLGPVAGQVRGEAMSGRVQGDDQKTHSRQPAQQSDVCPPAEGQAMQEDQRDALATHGHAHLVPVVERHYVVGQPHPGSRGRLAGYRCLTHMTMVNQARDAKANHTAVGLVTVALTCDERHDIRFRCVRGSLRRTRERNECPRRSIWGIIDRTSNERCGYAQKVDARSCGRGCMRCVRRARRPRVGRRSGESAQATINRLQDEGYTVNIDRIGYCADERVRRDQCAEPQAGHPMGALHRPGRQQPDDRALVLDVVSQSISVTLDCTRH